MPLRIIIPVKPFSEAKQRLAAVMTGAARARLAEEMFHHVLSVACAFAGPAAIIVISRGPDVLDHVTSLGATALAERSPSELNCVLLQAAAFALNDGASKLLVVASDLPQLCEADLGALLLHDCGVAPDRHSTGTNALLWPTSPLPGFHFGENSFAQHCEAARAAGFDPKIVFSAGLANDIDTPADLLSSKNEVS
jgi:2-phospho-L-lactate guanylyltransferase